MNSKPLIDYYARIAKEWCQCNRISFCIEGVQEWIKTLPDVDLLNLKVLNDMQPEHKVFIDKELEKRAEEILLG
jgi:hypothetical protein